MQMVTDIKKTNDMKVYAKSVLFYVYISYCDAEGNRHGHNTYIFCFNLTIDEEINHKN